ncbi:MAG TPA: hypothetical protein VK988_10875 [Acidimicrobiales bacterium]|nr:hypothetical protein [Acidimicrobiales bacterium]
MFSALFILVAACSGDGTDLGPSATLGTAPTTATTSPAPDPSVIPADPAAIDEVYVQAVVDALFAVDAKATKIFVETKDITNEEALSYLRAIYVPEELERQVNAWFQALALRSDDLLPGALRNDVQRVIDVASDCVYAEVLRDYSETSSKAVGLGRIFLGVTPKTEANDAESVNPTAWMMFMNGLNPDGTEPENPCEGR